MKHCDTRRNCLLQAISPFSYNVFYIFISLEHQNATLCGNGLNALHAKITFYITIQSMRYSLARFSKSIPNLLALKDLRYTGVIEPKLNSNMITIRPIRQCLSTCFEQYKALKSAISSILGV